MRLLSLAVAIIPKLHTHIAQMTTIRVYWSYYIHSSSKDVPFASISFLVSIRMARFPLRVCIGLCSHLNANIVDAFELTLQRSTSTRNGV